MQVKRYARRWEWKNSPNYARNQSYPEALRVTGEKSKKEKKKTWIRLWGTLSTGGAKNFPFPDPTNKTLSTKHARTHPRTQHNNSRRKTLKPAAPTILYLIYCSEELEEKLREPPPKKGEKKKSYRLQRGWTFPWGAWLVKTLRSAPKNQNLEESWT